MFFSSWDDLGESWVGDEISEITTVWGEPDKIEMRDDEVKAYIYHLKKIDPTCVHTWFVNQQGVIVEYEYEGRWHSCVNLILDQIRREVKIEDQVNMLFR